MRQIANTTAVATYNLNGSGGESLLSNQATSVTWQELSLMFVMLLITGNPYIDAESDMFLVLLSSIPIIHIIRNNHRQVSYRTILIFIFFLGYEIMHAIMFKLDYSFTIFKLALVLLIGAAIVDILGNKFITVLTRAMVIISYVSFFFVFISYTPLFSPLYKLGLKLFPVPEYNNIIPSTIIVYTFSWEYYKGILPYVRNCGIFWEGGAFAVFLNITLYLHFASRSIKSIRDLFDKQAIVLMFALVTTTSTMGAISLMTILLFFSLQLKSAFKYILLVLIIVSGVLAFTTVDFMGKKITKQLSESKVSNNRFGAALKDFENIAERPLLGWSRRIEVLFNTSVRSAKTHRPNGFTNFLRNYGLVYFTVYFSLVFVSFKKIHYHFSGVKDNMVPLFGVLLLFLVSFSEVIFDLLFLKSLLFLYAAYQSPTKELQPRLTEKKPFYF